MTNEQHIENLKKLLEQEPCEDEYIKVPKKALKYRTAGMVAYNVAWLREHWQMEMDIVYGVKPCEDAISRQAVEEIINDIRDCISVDGYWAILERLKKLPPVNPQPKTGHWITQWNPAHQKEYYYCPECREEYSYDGETGIKMNDYNYCPNCGAKMIEPQESEG